MLGRLLGGIGGSSVGKGREEDVVVSADVRAGRVEDESALVLEALCYGRETDVMCTMQRRSISKISLSTASSRVGAVSSSSEHLQIQYCKQNVGEDRSIFLEGFFDEKVTKLVRLDALTFEALAYTCRIASQMHDGRPPHSSGAPPAASSPLALTSGLSSVSSPNFIPHFTCTPWRYADTQLE